MYDFSAGYVSVRLIGWRVSSASFSAAGWARRYESAILAL